MTSSSSPVSPLCRTTTTRATTTEVLRRFPVQLQVGVTEGASPGVDRQSGHHGAGHCRQTPRDVGSTHQHYTTDEDSSGIALNVKAGLTDTDGSETPSYQIKWASGQGTLTLNGKVLTPGGERPLYGGWCGDINKVTVVPGKDYSGDIKLIVTPVSTEKTPVVTGKETFLGDPLEVIVNVNPLADDAKLTVREIQGKEDTLIDLGSKIGLAHLGDTTDGSEQLFVRISGLPAGATCCWAGWRSLWIPTATTRCPMTASMTSSCCRPKQQRRFRSTIKGW